MSYSALSEDESDHESGTNLGRSRYAIVKEAWRSDELVIWLRTMDLLACGEKWDGRNVAQQGNSRRLRIHSPRSKHGIAVAGLPKNCYNPDWLNALDRHERESLQIKPPQNMQFSEQERRFVFCCHCAQVSTPTIAIVGRLQSLFRLQMARPETQKTLTLANLTIGFYICTEKSNSDA